MSHKQINTYSCDICGLEKNPADLKPLVILRGFPYAMWTESRRGDVCEECFKKPSILKAVFHKYICKEKP